MTAAVNTPTPINIDLDGNTVAGIVVPPGAKKITQILASIAASIVAVASAGVTVAVRLFGDGIDGPQQELTVGGVREDTTSTAGFKPTQPFELGTDIPVIAGATLKASYSIGGVDPGSPEIELTLGFE